jgi:hypothetical protein
MIASFASPPAPPPLPVEDQAIEERRGAARLGSQELKREPVHRLRLRDLGNYYFFFYCFRNLPLLGNLEFTPVIR